MSLRDHDRERLITDAETLAEYVDGLAAGLTSEKLGRAALAIRSLCREVKQLAQEVSELREASRYD